jgi:hypothetical protein
MDEVTSLAFACPVKPFKPKKTRQTKKSQEGDK